MGFLTPMDSAFLMMEGREHPMHVGALQLYEPPEDAGPDYARQVYDYLLAHTEARPLYRSRPAFPVGSLGQIRMVVDPEVDLDYHVRLSALPRPGRIRELLALVCAPTAACSTGTGRYGRCTSSRASRAGGWGSTTRFTTACSTASPR